jgi:signal transduction histidine kinase
MHSQVAYMFQALLPYLDRARMPEAVKLHRGISPFSALVACVVALIAALWIALGFYLEFEKAASYKAAERRADNYSRLFEEHTLRTARMLDQTTLYVKREFEQRPANFDLGTYAREGLFLDKFFNLIAIAAADGWVTTIDRSLKPSNISDREHFRVHVDDDTGSVFISKPVLGRSSGKWSMQFTRRINKPNGSFGGVVIASLDPAYFSSFYKTVDIGEGGITSLVGTDGIVRARRSGEFTDAGQDIRGSILFERLQTSDNGSFIAPSSVDGVSRLLSYRKLRDYPLVVTVGIAESEILAEYNEHRKVLQGLGGVITLLIVLGGFAGMVLINSQKRERDALMKSEQAAQSASRTKSEFIARMSHELRTPLNGILGFADFLSHDAENPEHREFAATIHEAGKHLLALVNATLDLAKIESGCMELRYQDESLATLVQRSSAIHKAFADGKGLSLDVNVDGRVPSVLSCDSTKLTQVLNNLIHNALKFTDQGGVTVTVRPGGDNIVFRVTDTGPGISAESQSLLFERFRQLESFATRSHEGSGLGLALAKELVELMGGRIWIESEPGSGTSFIFTLPVHKSTSTKEKA